MARWITEEQREKRRIADRLRYFANKERVAATHKAYYETHKDEIATAGKAYYETHKEQRSITSKAYYETHKEQRSITSKAYREAHKDEIAATGKAYCETHKEQTAATQRIWRRTSEGRASCRRDRQSRRAAKRGVLCTLTIAEWQTVLDEYSYQCAYCGVSLSASTLTIDHVVPLSHGGLHTRENVVPACRTCNDRKCTKSVEDFRRENAFDG